MALLRSEIHVPPVQNSVSVSRFGWLRQMISIHVNVSGHFGKRILAGEGQVRGPPAFGGPHLPFASETELETSWPILESARAELQS